jgi:hypothetical protein
MKTALIIALFAGPLSACCMVPGGYAGDVDQSAQRVVVLHRAASGDTPGYQEMLIRVQPFFQGAESNPDHLVWVVTVPSKPLRYEVADLAALDAGPALHERLFQLARRQWADRSDFGWPDWLPILNESRDMKAAEPLLEIDNAVTVGPYTITPVRATGADAVTELNAYLAERGFPQEDPDHVRYFIDNDFTFLCIRIAPPAGQASLGRKLDLPPLVLGFETESPYYPGKFSSRQGNFALDLTVISDRPLEIETLDVMRKRLDAINEGYVQLVNLYSVKPLPEELARAFGERAQAEPPERWFVNRIRSTGFNPGGDAKPAISEWPDDVFLKLGGKTDELPGFWYYADEELSWFEKFFREHALAFMVWAGIVFFGSLFIKTRINRKRLRPQA